MDISLRDFEQCADLAKEADNVQERIIRLQATAEGAGLQKGFKPPTKSDDPVGESVANLDKLQRLWQGILNRYLVLLGHVDAAITALDDPSVREVLRLRYIDGLPWDEVGEKVNYASSHCRRLCNKGLKELGLKGAA